MGHSSRPTGGYDKKTQAGDIRAVVTALGYDQTSVVAQPSYFTYGDESRTDNTLRTPGIANWDMSLYKNIPVHEDMALNFRVEAFNLFSRVQFGVPNGQLGTSTLGWITAQANSPESCRSLDAFPSDSAIRKPAVAHRGRLFLLAGFEEQRIFLIT